MENKSENEIEGDELDLDEEESSMTFLDHLEELRWVIAKSAAAFIIGCILVAVGFFQVYDFLMQPYFDALKQQEILQSTGLVTTKPFQVFTVFMQVGFLGGLGVSLPFMMYFVGGFIAPGLNDREKRILIPGCTSALVLFITGSVFSFTFLVPAALNVAIYFNELLGLQMIWTASDYFNILLWMVLGIGLSFEFPLVLVILVFIGLLTRAQLAKSWRFAFTACFVAAAVITPTGDPVTMTLVAAPLFLLYLGSVFVAGFVEKKQQEAEAAEAEAEAAEEDGEADKDQE